MKVQLADIDAMMAFGVRIADRLCVGDIVALSGDLGAGKTTLARAILHALGHEGEVPSPSFTVLETYDGAAMRLPAIHADFYRLEDPEEVVELGLEEYRDGTVLLAEWPENAGGFAQEAACLSVRLEVADGGRVAIVEGGADWLGRMP